MSSPLMGVVAMIVLLVACANGGETKGRRLRVDRLTELEVGYVGLRALCPPGKVTVEFQPGREVLFRRADVLLGFASPKEIAVSCPGVKRVSRPQQIISPRDLGKPVFRSTTLACSFPIKFELWANPVFQESGGLRSVELSIYDVRRRIVIDGRTIVYRRALIDAGIDLGDDSSLQWAPAACRISDGS